MARPLPRHRRQTTGLLVLALLATAAIAGSTVSTAAVTTQGTDALGRIVPPGTAGPVQADGPLGELAQDQHYDVGFETVDVSSDYAVETYKNDYRLNTRSADDFENQTTNWDHSLGHHIRFTVEVDDGRATLDCDDAFIAVAYIETTSGPLYGWTNGTFAQPQSPDDVCLEGLPGVRVYEIVFDLDGAPPTVTGSAFPALLSGFYTATLELYHHEPGPANPTGQGPLAGVHEIGFALQDPRLTLDPELHRFPEQILRLLGDTGSHATHTHQFAMPIRAMTPDDTWNLTLEFPGTLAGTPFTRIDHHATRTLPGTHTPADPGSTIGDNPLDPLLHKLADQSEREALGVEVHRTDYEHAEVPESRKATMDLTTDGFTTRADLLDEDYVPLHVLTIHIPASLETFATGAQSIIVPVSLREHPVRGLSVEEAAADIPVTQITLQDDDEETGGPLAADPGDLFALRPIGSGHEMITRSPLQRDQGSQWVRGEVRHMDFDQDTRRYRLLSMLYGPLDEFLGMRIIERGIEIDAQPARYVEHTTGSLPVTIRHLPAGIDGGPTTTDLETTIHLSGRGLGDGSYDKNITLRAGETRVVDLPLAGSPPGDYTARITATSGELTARQEVPILVISTEDARDADRRWYEIPAPGVLLVLTALLAIVPVLRRRTG